MYQSENKNQINHYDKQRRELVAILLCARVNEKPIAEPRRAEPKTYRQAPNPLVKVLRRGRH